MTSNARLLMDALRTIQRKFVYDSSYTNRDLVTELNNVLDLYDSVYFVNLRDKTKRVTGFGASSNTDKVIIRYNDRRNSTVFIRNLHNNVIAVEPDEWDEPSEEAEENFLLQRLGIKV